ncbi:hypothetical protein ACJMK2_016040 [Sinanodonta woodiana]|uniref:Beta-microseminoprotein n=1 Tax=Sinanodonta woodiana TaxID=1069815 RepID=A0ABD3USC5_SINWO
MNRKTPLQLLVVLVVLHRVESYCFASAPTAGSNVCEYKGVQYKPGSFRIKEDCVDCTCSSAGVLSCCAYGIHAGVFQLPSGCKMRLHEDGCTGHAVRTNDETQPCDTPFVLG